MADNIPVSTGASGNNTTIPDGTVIAADDVGGVKYPVTKVDVGADGLSSPLVRGQQTTANSLPVTLPSDATLPLPTGAATAIRQDTGNTSLASIDGKLPALSGGKVPTIGPLTDTELRATAVPVSSTTLATSAKQDALQTAVDAINTKTPALSGGSVPVTGPLTDIQLRATAVPISDGGGTVTVDGSVSVSGLVPGTTATSLGKAEDAVAADGDTGVMALAVRKDVAATTVGADGDYHPLLVDANGRLHVIEPSAAGSLAALGATTGAAVITDANGSIQQYLRGIIKLAITGGGWLVTASLAAGANIIGKVGIDQTTPGTTNAVALISGQNGVAGGAGNVGATVQRMTLAADDPAVATLGGTTGAAVVTDVNGAIQQYLRGLVKMASTAGSFLVTAAIGVKATLWQAAPVSRGTVLTTELNSLGNGLFSALGTAIDNTTNSDQYCAFDIVLGSLNPTGTPTLSLYLAQSLDGTTYEDAPGSTNVATHQLFATVNISTGSGAKRVMTPWGYVPPGKWKLSLLNSTNVSLAASANTVTAYTSNDEAQ